QCECVRYRRAPSVLQRHAIDRYSDRPRPIRVDNDARRAVEGPAIPNDTGFAQRRVRDYESWVARSELLEPLDRELSRDRVVRTDVVGSDGDDGCVGQTERNYAEQDDAEHHFDYAEPGLSFSASHLRNPSIECRSARCVNRPRAERIAVMR